MINKPYLAAVLFMLFGLSARFFILDLRKEMGKGKFIIESLLELIVFLSISYLLGFDYANSIRLFVAGSALLTVFWLGYYRYKKKRA